MVNDRKTEENSLFKFDEGRAALEICFTAADESDRGAVLVCAALVDEYLKKLYEQIGSDRMSSRSLSRLLSYPGALGSMAAKADVALLTGLIGSHVHEAIGILRKIRNSVAHSPTDFRLANHDHELRRLYELGSGMGHSVNEFAIRSFMDIVVQRFLENPELHELYRDNGGLSREVVIQKLSQSPDLLARLDASAGRFELGMAVAMLCALIVWSWKRAVSPEEI